MTFLLHNQQKLGSTYRYIYYTALIFVFIVGGTLQLFHIISYTGLNLLLTVSFTLYLLLSIIYFKKLDFNAFVLLNAFLICGVVSFGVNDSDVINLSYFLIQVFMWGSVYFFIKKAPLHLVIKSTKLLFYISLVQLPVIITQRLLYPFFQKHIINLNVSSTDIGFGTFSLAEDHVLGFLMISILLMILNGNFKVKSKLFSVIYLTISILTINSKITIIILMIFGGYYLLKRQIKLFLIVFMLSVIIVPVLLNTKAIQQLIYKVDFVHKYLKKDSSIENATYRIENNTSSRKDVIIYFINQPISWIGLGPGSYHNYETRELFNGHFGQTLWYYRDFGIIGLALSFILLMLIPRRYPSGISRLLLIIAFVYSIFTNLFFSLAFLLLYNIFLRYNNIHEHRNNTIPRLAKN